MMIVAGDPSDFRTISDFKALAALFCAGVEARGKGGPCEARARGLDGTKIKTNASKH
jgi:hypothetical protein